MTHAVNFRAVHTEKSWRGTGHSSFDNAFEDPKRGARALFRGTNEYVLKQGYGDPLYGFVWDEKNGYAVRPNPNTEIQIVEVPVELLKEFEAAKQMDEGKVLPYFNGLILPPAFPVRTHERKSHNRIAADQVAWWWVNHKQTFRAEFEGGYIWSPKKNSNGARNQTYDNLTLVNSGDIVVSYAAGLIKALGVATAGHVEAAKPEEFGNAGAGWSDLGWMVPIDWIELIEPIRPKDHLSDIQPLLPAKNSPLRSDGNGNQGCYLASISPQLGGLLTSLVWSSNAAQVASLQEISTSALEDEIEKELSTCQDVPATEKIQLVRARRGQGVFRQRVLAIDNKCRITGVDDQRFLIASHIKPWRDCTNEERLDGNNGLMLSPHADALFDKHLISFKDNGALLVSDEAAQLMAAWKLSALIDEVFFNEEQQKYLADHWEEFLDISKRS